MLLTCANARARKEKYFMLRGTGVMKKVSKNLVILAVLGACVATTLLCIPNTPKQETVLHPDLTVAVRRWHTPNNIVLDIDIINNEKEKYDELFIICSLLDNNGYPVKKIATLIKTSILPAFNEDPRITRIANVVFKPTNTPEFSAITCEAIGDGIKDIKEEIRG